MFRSRPEGAGDSPTRLLSEDPEDIPALPVPELDGLADLVERERVFEALFRRPAPTPELGRYMVLGTLGRGGMGVVLEAFDRTLERRVAVKVLRQEYDERYTARLLREAQAMAKLSHPNVVQVYEVGELDGRTFVAMELVRGQTLRTWMQQEPRPTWKQVVTMFIAVGRGLAAAHAQGLIHRDFKPSNAIVDEEGRPRVLDFGLVCRSEPRAAATSETDESTLDMVTDDQQPALDLTLTLSGAVMGTPSYMPLEQMAGREADARSDQFSFCVSLWEALHGERPYRGDSLSTLMNSMIVGDVQPSGKGSVVPVALRKILRRGLAPCAADRWPSMDALLAELQALTTLRLRRWIGAGVGAALLLATIGGFVVVSKNEQLDAKDEVITDKQTEIEQQVVELQHMTERLSAELDVQKGLRATMLAKEPGHELEAVALAVEAFGGPDRPADSTPTPVLEGLIHALVRVHRGFALQGHHGEVTGVAFSPDGRLLATASWDGSARLWNAYTGAPLRTFEGHAGKVLAVAVSADGTRVATGGEDMTARIWDRATGTLLESLPHQRPVDDVAFFPQGLATVSGETAWVWHGGPDPNVVPLVGHAGRIGSLAFAPDGAWVVTAGEDQTARVWDPTTGALLTTLRGHTGPLTGVTCSLDGTRLATASRDRTARLWDAATGEPLASFSHDDAVHAVALSPDGRRLAAATWDGTTAHLWDTATGRRLASFRHAGPVVDVAFSPRDHQLATASWDHTARSWDLDPGGAILTLQGHTGRVDAVAFSPDGSRVATASGDDTARVWDARSGAHLATLRGHAMAVLAVAFSPDGRHLATASWDGTARLWDTATAALLHTFVGHAGPVRGVAFFPDGTRLVTAGADRTARVWDAATGEELRSWPHEGPVVGAASTPEGRRVLTVSEGRRARVWDVVTGAGLGGFPDEGPATAGAVSARDARVAISTAEHTMRSWNADSGEELPSIEGHAAPILAAAFSADGTRLATASEDHTARTWDATTGALLAVLPHEDPVVGVALSPDGTRLATASGERDARLWTLEPRVWLEWGCAVLDGRQAHTEATRRACLPNGVEPTAPDLALTSGHPEPVITPADATEPAPDVITVHGVELVLVPGGTFVMGSPRDEKQRTNDEGPPHEVTLDDFYMARTEVTNAQYALYLEANPEIPAPPSWGDERYDQPDQPVVTLSWYDAQGYCDWAGLALPTEAQWEYAARGGRTTAYWFGDDEQDLARFGWYLENAEGRMHSVGTLDANPFGLHDVHGNVWEWCADAYEPYTTHVRAADGLRKRPVGDAFRVIRGGSHLYEARYARSAFRLEHDPRYRGTITGLRPVLRAPGAGALGP